MSKKELENLSSEHKILMKKFMDEIGDLREEKAKLEMKAEMEKKMSSEKVEFQASLLVEKQMAVERQK
jgi:hypothetical protein